MSKITLNSIGKYFLIIIILLPFGQVIGQSLNFELAIIEDKDGYTNVRMGKGITQEIYSQIIEGDFFYCLPSEESWWEIQLILSGSPRETLYVHQSRIKLFSNLADEKQSKIISENIDNYVLRKEQEQQDGRSERFDETCEFYGEKYVEPLLPQIPPLFKEDWKEEVVSKLIKYIEVNPGSASEEPWNVLGGVYWYHPEKLIKLIDSKEAKLRSRLYWNLEFGLGNFLYNKQNMRSFDEDRANELIDTLNKKNN